MEFQTVRFADLEEWHCEQPVIPEKMLTSSKESSPKSVNATGPCLQVDLAQQPLNIPKNGKVSCTGWFSSGIHFKILSSRYSTWEFNKKSRNTMWNINYLGWTKSFAWVKKITNTNYWIFLEDSLIEVSSPWDSASFFSYKQVDQRSGEFPMLQRAILPVGGFERNHERRVASSNWICEKLKHGWLRYKRFSVWGHKQVLLKGNYTL